VISITNAEPEDAEALARLAEEMDRFYGASEFESLEVRVRQIREALFSNSPSAHSLLVWDSGRLTGFASYSFLWPAVGLTRSLYLKELYVVEEARRKGIGKLLMQNLYDIAVKHNCSRVEWTTDSDNPCAQQFYSELGVPAKESKLFYRIEGEDLKRQADRWRRRDSSGGKAAYPTPRRLACHRGNDSGSCTAVRSEEI
jgi:GNAT superfamily N-acetyltransferase